MGKVRIIVAMVVWLSTAVTAMGAENLMEVHESNVRSNPTVEEALTTGVTKGMEKTLQTLGLRQNDVRIAVKRYSTEDPDTIIIKRARLMAAAVSVAAINPNKVKSNQPCIYYYFFKSTELGKLSKPTEMIYLVAGYMTSKLFAMQAHVVKSPAKSSANNIMKELTGDMPDNVIFGTLEQTCRMAYPE